MYSPDTSLVLWPTAWRARGGLSRGQGVYMTPQRAIRCQLITANTHMIQTHCHAGFYPVTTHTRAAVIRTAPHGATPKPLSAVTQTPRRTASCQPVSWYRCPTAMNQSVVARARVNKTGKKSGWHQLGPVESGRVTFQNANVEQRIRMWMSPT